MPGKILRKLQRRSFLSASALLSCGVGCPWLVAATERPVFQRLGDSIRVITGLGGNVLVFNIAGGIVVVDTGNAESAETLAFELADMEGGDNVHTVFNTHWHPDQVGGNAALRNMGANIISHRKTLLHLATPYYLFEEDRYQPAMPEAAWPTETFYTGGELVAAGEVIEYGYLQSAHTDGDIYVRFTGQNVIAAGDVVSPHRDPGFDWFGGGWIGGRVDALNQILDLCDDQTRIVPTFGAAVGRTHVEAERDLMQFLYDTLVDQIRMGFDFEDSLASGVMDNLPRKFDDPAKFLYDAHKGLWAHHNKLEPNIV